MHKDALREKKKFFYITVPQDIKYQGKLKECQTDLYISRFSVMSKLVGIGYDFINLRMTCRGRQKAPHRQQQLKPLVEYSKEQVGYMV